MRDKIHQERRFRRSSIASFHTLAREKKTLSDAKAKNTLPQITCMFYILPVCAIDETNQTVSHWMSERLSHRTVAVDLRQKTNLAHSFSNELCVIRWNPCVNDDDSNMIYHTGIYIWICEPDSDWWVHIIDEGKYIRVLPAVIEIVVSDWCVRNCNVRKTKEFISVEIFENYGRNYLFLHRFI